jgi:hypothetical protein
VKLLKKIVYVLVFVATVLVIVSCGETPNNGDFNFTMSYNVEGRDYISTIDNKFIVDTVEGQKEINFIFSGNDKALIKQKIIDSSILKENYRFLKNTYAMVTPCEVCKLDIQIDGKKHSFKWTSENMMPFSFDMVSNKVIVEEKYKDDYEKLRKLYEIKGYIIDLIYKYPEVKALPEHQMYE